MGMTIYPGIDIYGEAIAMLELLASDGSPLDTKKSLISRYGVSPKLLEEPFGVCMKIFEKGRRRLKPYMNLIREYFTPFGQDNQCSVSSFILLKSDNDYRRSYQERKEISLSYGEKLRCKEFMVCLGTGLNILDEDGKNTIPQDFQGLLDYLEQAEYTPEQKWQIQGVFRHPREYWEKLEPALLAAMEVLKESRELWQPLVDSFVREWEERLFGIGIYEYVRRETAFDFEENPLGVSLIPSLMHMGLLSWSTRMEDEDNPPCEDVYRMGLAVSLAGLGNLLVGGKSNKQIADALKILSDESKLEILSLLKERRYYGGELARKLKLTTATISHHMSILVGNGLVTISKEMNRVYYALNEATIEKLLEDTRKLLLRE